MKLLRTLSEGQGPDHHAKVRLLNAAISDENWLSELESLREMVNRLSELAGRSVPGELGSIPSILRVCRSKVNTLLSDIGEG